MTVNHLRFYNAKTTQIDDNPMGRPAVQVVLPREIKDLPEGRAVYSGQDTWREVWALVDTGADHCVIDTALADRLGWKPWARSLMTGFGAEEVAMVHSQEIYLPGSRTICNTHVITANLASGNHWSPFIVGMSLIRQGTLRMDFSSGIFTLGFT